MKKYKLISFILLVTIFSCAVKTKDIKKEEPQVIPPVEITKESLSEIPVEVPKEEAQKPVETPPEMEKQGKDVSISDTKPLPDRPEIEKEISPAIPGDEKLKKGATVVTGVKVEKEDVLRVIISGNGEIGYKTFILKPNRLVIDIPDTINKGKPVIYNVNDPPLKSVRIGQHITPKKKVRVVLDLIEPFLYEINKTENQLIISLKTGTSLGVAKEGTKKQTPPKGIKPDEKKPPEEKTLKPPALTTPAQPNPTPTPEKKDGFILLNFDEADLKDITSLVSEVTGVNFIISPGVTAKITVHSAKKVPSSELFSIFESILEINGLTAVKSGNFYKIVQSAIAKQKALEVKRGSEPSSIIAEDKFITQIVPLEFIPVSEAFTMLQPIISPTGSITYNTRNNLLIISDVSSNIRRLVEILKEVDVSAFDNTRIRVFAPNNVDVKTLSRELIDILNALNLGKEGISLIPLERINKLIIFSPSEKFLQTIEDWARKLDEETAPSGLTTYVYPIQNVKAKEIAEVLKTIYETKEGIKPVTPAPTPVTTKPATPPITPPKPGTPAPTPTPPLLPKPKVEITEGRGIVDIKIVVYEPTNSLVIMASPADYRQIVETIKKLDIYPQQVLIEVLIAEVSLTDATRFGIQWSLLSQDRAKVFGETHTFEGLSQFRPGESLYSKQESPLPPTISGGLAPTVGGYSYLLYEAGRLTGMLHALATEGKVNVLSSPHLLVKDNQEASIDVGQEIPVATGTTQQTVAAEAPIVQSIQYKTVGVKLKMKPVINAEKTVVLDLTQEVSEYSADVTVGKEGFTYPAFSKREAKTSIIVSDGQSIIIGGIMKEMKKKGYEGIPLLSEIPLLGYLFRYTTSNIDKTELIILLTPHVVSSKSEADLITLEFKERVKDLNKPLKKIEMEKEKREREKKEREEEKKKEQEEK